MIGEIRIVFDGPPGHESGRFVEATDAEGQSIDAGEWVRVNGGFWELRIIGVDLTAVARAAEQRRITREAEEEEAHEEELANGQFGVGA